MSGSWSDHADRVLATLFRLNQPAPTDEQLRDAYPFGERSHFPYKVWLARVKAWKAAHAKGMAMAAAARVRDPREADRETADLFGGHHA